MKRAILTILGWVAVIACLLWAMIGIEVDINFFSWEPRWSFQVFGCLTGILALLACIRFLVKATVGRVALIVSLMACALVMMLGLGASRPEACGPPGQWFSRTRSSPSWYRYTRAVVTATPMLAWTWAFWRLKRQPKNACKIAKES